jgi:hypothetical protein
MIEVLASYQMHDSALGTDVAFFHRTVARFVRNDLTVSLEARAEIPAQVTYQSEVVQTAVPTVEENVFRR